MKGINEDDFVGLSSTKKSFIACIRSILKYISGSLPVDLIADMLIRFYRPVSVSKICDLPSAWVQLQIFLDKRGAHFYFHSIRRKTPSLASGLYQDVNEKNAAIEMTNLVIASGRRARPEIRKIPASFTNAAQCNKKYNVNIAPTQFRGNRMDCNIEMRLEDADKTFSGDLKDYWMEFVGAVLQISKDYCVNGEQKKQFLHKMRSKDKKRY